jgi:hypothetical protein
MAATFSEQASRRETAEANEASPVSAAPVMARGGFLSVSPAAAGVTVSLAVVFCYFVFLPLWHTDLWGHLSYGRYLYRTAALPETEPLMPLSEGVSFVDTAWLCQLLGYETIRLFGVAGIQYLHAVGVTFCLTLVAWRVWSRTRSALFALLSVALFLWVGWQHLAVVRPQLAGLVCFSILFALLSPRRWSKINWAAVPLLFAVWANLHGSFLVGLAVLGACCVGRGCDVLRRTDKFSNAVSNRGFRRYLLLCELAAAAVLLNPYGIGLYAEVWTISGNANLSDIVEWEPLTLRMKQGQAAALVALALVMVFRVSPRRVRVAEILLLAGLGGAALWTSRMIIWWAPVAGYFVALHGHAAWQAARKKRSNANPAVRRGLWLGVSAVAVVMAVAAKPLEPVFRGGRENVARVRLSADTPVAAVRHLRENPPIGQIFNSYEWGDYLIWAGPPDAKVFVASHAHLVPREVWQSYMQVMNMSTGWEDVLARFGANTVLIEKQRRRGLVARLRDHDDWQISFEDNQAIVFRRTVPIGTLAYQDG